MPPIRQLGRGTVGGTYLQALRPRGTEPSYSVKDADLGVKYYKDFYERSSAQLRWVQFQGGDGWRGSSAAAHGQPYAPWQPHRSA